MTTLTDQRDGYVAGAASLMPRHGVRDTCVDRHFTIAPASVRQRTSTGRLVPSRRAGRTIQPGTPGSSMASQAAATRATRAPQLSRSPSRVHRVGNTASGSSARCGPPMRDVACGIPRVCRHGVAPRRGLGRGETAAVRRLVREGGMIARHRRRGGKTTPSRVRRRRIGCFFCSSCWRAMPDIGSPRCAEAAISLPSGCGRALYFAP